VLTLNFWLLLGIAVSASVILLLRDWRLTCSALFVNYLCQALFLSQQQFLSPDLHPGPWSVSTVVLVKVLTGVAVTAMLVLTALTFSRDYGLEDLDEFGLTELRRAARTAQR
jgi:ABC-type sugar transport system permease subunit